MLETGDDAPDFTAMVVEDETNEFTLSERLQEETPVVFVFFPGPFTEVCTNEMVTFDESLGAFEDVGANVYGVHTDTPGSLEVFKEANDLGFGLISDTKREIVDAYDVRRDFEAFGIYDVPDRAVYVVDEDGTIVYSWVAEEPAHEPDYEAVQDATAEAA